MFTGCQAHRTRESTLGQESRTVFPLTFKSWPALVTRAEPTETSGEKSFELSVPRGVGFQPLRSLSSSPGRMLQQLHQGMPSWFKVGLCEPEVQPGCQMLCFSGGPRAGGRALQRLRLQSWMGAVDCPYRGTTSTLEAVCIDSATTL